MFKVQCAICFTPQEIVLESFESIEEVANILETNFHKLTETEVEIFNKQTIKMRLKEKKENRLKKLILNPVNRWPLPTLHSTTWAQV